MTKGGSTGLASAWQAVQPCQESLVATHERSERHTVPLAWAMEPAVQGEEQINLSSSLSVGRWSQVVGLTSPHPGRPEAKHALEEAGEAHPDRAKPVEATTEQASRAINADDQRHGATVTCSALPEAAGQHVWQGILLLGILLF